MRVKRLAAFVCALYVFFQVPAFSKNLVRDNACADLQFIEHLLQVKYAPRVWKQDLLSWNLEEETRRARLQFFLEEEPSTKYCQQVLANYFVSLNDYHAGIVFFATESSSLPYTLKLSEDGKCFVVDVHTYNSEISKGDEILEFDNMDISSAIESVRTGRGTSSDYATAVRTLVSRSASLGHTVPVGIVNLKIRRPSGLVRTIKVRWRHTPESIADLSLITPLIKEPKLSFNSCIAKNHNTSCLKSTDSLFTTSMVPYFWSELRKQYRSGLSSDFNIGSKRGFLPDFGLPIWKQSDGPYHAYIFQLMGKNGHMYNIGFVRISTYAWEEMEDRDPDNLDAPWKNFEQIILHMQANTDALIVDQTNNPGGSVFYLYGLISMLTDRPLSVPLHRMILTQDEVSTAVNWLNMLDGVDNEEQVHTALGEDMEGYVMDMNAVGYLQSFSHRVLDCWGKGDINLSSPIPLLGFANVHPHPRASYDKPICVLINEDNYSCADLFAAIMKDNNRALLIGKCTAGAGGFVFNVAFPNRSGIKNCSLTGSLAIRKDGSLIENLGVSPHVSLDVTSRDVQTGRYSDYIGKVKETLLTFLEEEKAKGNSSNQEMENIS
ncbi:peptidase S41 family protein [Chlamydia ibidis]|uniref:Peptidase S41 family protein n=2 Tax=Chlamydia ibidis TaxID=1405396 RepID=S7KK63_9CHLA|nr:protease-like activity factor CPAF [Chlamydia ibidis]EPP34805.1 peptidase S41 family protein [Chlamydia ibidis]EQM62458.1 peptidase S41 family protein [Chlamydia ibidis 10-1398/6]